MSKAEPDDRALFIYLYLTRPLLGAVFCAAARAAAGLLRREVGSDGAQPSRFGQQTSNTHRPEQHLTGHRAGSIQEMCRILGCPFHIQTCDSDPQPRGRRCVAQVVLPPPTWHGGLAYPTGPSV